MVKTITIKNKTKKKLQKEKKIKICNALKNKRYSRGHKCAFSAVVYCFKPHSKLLDNLIF